MKKKNIFYIGIGLITLISLFIFIEHSLSVDNGWKKVETVKVKESFTVTGIVDSQKKGTITAPLTGTIDQVNVIESNNVSKNQILAVYDQKKYLSQIKQLQNKLEGTNATYLKYKSGMRKEDIAKAKFTYEQALDLLNEKKLILNQNKREMDRYKNLFNKQLISKNDFDSFVSEYNISKQLVLAQQNMVNVSLNQYNLLKEGYRQEDIQLAKSKTKNIQAKIEEMNVLLNKCTIKSPLTGQIIKKFIDNGQNVVTGEPLFNIINSTDLDIKASIEEENINNIRVNDLVEIIPDAYPNEIITGQIVSIYDKVDENTRLLPIRIKISEDSKNLKLLTGMTVSCKFKGHYLNYLVVPHKALQRQGKRYFVKTKTGKVFLEVGKKHDSKVLVKGNLTPNEEIFVE